MKLFIESSTSYLYLALINGANNPYFVRCGRFDHSETLVDFLKAFLENNNVDASSIKEVYIGRGPGSYTGIRIAGTVGKVLSFLTSAKLYSFSSLDFILASFIEKEGIVQAKIEAKKDASYIKILEVKNNKYTFSQESFASNTALVTNYPIVVIDETLLNNGANIALMILKYKLYQEENNLDYTPNYLRNVI